MLNVLIFGASADISKNFANYLGNNSKSQSALVYFEFPNEKFQHPTILKNFPEKMKFYLLQPQLLQTMLAPKKEFNAASFIIWMFDWNDAITSLEEGMKYFQKIIDTRKSFLPILFIGYRKEENQNPELYISFLQYFQFHKKVQELIQMQIDYLEIVEGRTESGFLIRLKAFLSKYLESYGEHYQITHYSTIAIEEIFKEFNEYIQSLNQKGSFDDYVRDLALTECELKNPITRRYLIMRYGCSPPIAKKIIDTWNTRPLLEEIPIDSLNDLKKEANIIWNACETSRCAPNLVELIRMGYNPSISQYALRLFFQEGKITTISHHLESEDFVEFANIREIIVVHEGRTLYVKSINNNTDQTLMFSDMIQAIEMIRNDYVLRLEGQKIRQVNLIEFLEFGNLKALIGNGQKGVKLIIRLNNRPRNEQNLRQRVKNFLLAYENHVSLLPTTDVEEQKKIREESEKIFYHNFNPFPISIDVFHALKIKSYPQIPQGLLTKLEQQIIEVIKGNQKIMLEDLVEEISTEYNRTISRSDILQLILDLMEDGFID